jgi:hypothetical protein
MDVTVDEAKDRLQELIRSFEEGERVATAENLRLVTTDTAIDSGGTGPFQAKIRHSATTPLH